MKKSEVWGTRWAYLVDPSELETFEEHAQYLEAILTGPCVVWARDDLEAILGNSLPMPEGEGQLVLLCVKARMGQVGGMKIEIYPNEHAPPHFHVRSATIDASFSIEDCSLLAGDIAGPDYDKIRYWHQYSKPRLVEKWNLMRPTDCVVGPYRAGQS